MTARWTRWMVWVFIGLLALWFVYGVVVNAALRSSMVKRWVNTKPEKFYIEWKSGTSWIPGSFHVRGLYFVGQGTSCTYYGRMDDARFRVGLLPLLRRVVHASRFDGNGIEFRLRRPSGPGIPATATSEFYPSIPGLEALPRRTSPRSPRGSPSWWIRVDDVRFRGIEQVWLYGTRLSGPATLRAGLDMQVEGPFRLKLADMQFPAAVLNHNGAMVGTNLQMSLSGEMGPLVFDVDDVPDEKIFDFISATLAMQGDLHSVALLKQRLGRQDTIDFGGGGRLDAWVAIERGNVQPSTRLQLRSPNLRVLLGSVRFGGNATVEDRVDLEGGVAVARLSVTLEDFEVFKGDKRVGFAPGPALHLTSANRGLKLSEWAKETELSLRIRPLTISNIAVFNEFLPRETVASLERGEIKVEAEYDRNEAGGEGRIGLRGEQLAARARGESYATDLALDIGLKSSDPAVHRFELSGTSLTLTNVEIPGLSRERQEGWHTRMDVESGGVSWSKSTWAVEDAMLRFSMRDTRPVKALLVESGDAPSWLRLMPTIRELSGRVLLTASPEAFRLNQVHVEGRGTEVKAELMGTNDAIRGVVYARYGLLAAGFDLRSTSRRWRVLGAKRWYERVSTSPWDPSAPETPEEADTGESDAASGGGER
ncbi:MAG: hypothetical protein JNK85_29145 [Verrucomicrobiales bacterium]|nr:hypothetical protein [Verrucomicrobiales bacterium]